MPSISDASSIRMRPDIVSCALADGAALLDTTSGTYFSLNEVASHVWSMIQRPTPFGDLCASVSDSFDVEPQRCHDDLARLVHELSAASLVEVSG